MGCCDEIVTPASLPYALPCADEPWYMPCSTMVEDDTVVGITQILRIPRYCAMIMLKSGCTLLTPQDARTFSRFRKASFDFHEESRTFCTNTSNRQESGVKKIP